ncbi:hypothetical protein CPB86DRAFT_697097 [Serendipita vermifera]|nr:hypothetical protein CPB86DRAFT_697097 [Serendipita vermifera]
MLPVENTTKPTLPVEIIFPIITEALRPRLILDAHCTTENMAEFYYALTSRKIASKLSREARYTRQSLLLVNKTFHNIVQNVSEKNGIGRTWLYQADNDPRRYRSPSLKWGERDGNDNMKGLRRFDLEMEFEHSQQLHVVYPWSQISVFSLTVQRSSNAMGGLYNNAYIHSLKDIITFPEGLEALHVQMDFITIYQRPQFCRDISTNLSNLSTLSLTMAAQDSRGILDTTLHLPQLRTLFLAFTAFGLTESTLSLWNLPSLSFVSFHLPIGSRGVRPVRAVPSFVAKFLQQYGGQIEGLRLFPGPWTYTDKQSTIPMDEAEEAELWGSLTALRLFSTDFARFPPTTIPSSTLDFFSRIQHIWQKGKSAPNDYLDGVTALVNICSNLRTLRFDREGERVLGPTWSPLHSQNSRKLRKICEERRITLLGPPEETIIDTMGSGYKKELRARKESTGETRYIVNYLYGS